MVDVGALGPGARPPEPAPAPARAAGVPSPPALSAGEVVDAELVETLGRGDALLRLGSRLVRALVPEGLPRGEPLRLLVVAPGPPAVLRLPDPAEAAAARLAKPAAEGLVSSVRTLLAAALPADDPEAGALLASARSLLTLPPSPGRLAEALARWVRGSGVFHEASLARGEAPGDLKEVLLRLVARLGEGPVARAAEALLSHVETHQARSLVDGMPVVPLVLPWGDEPLHGELRLEERPTSRGGEPAGCLVVRLQMPRLGTVEARLQWGGGGVAVRLGLEPAALAAVAPRLGELADRLGGAGVRVRTLRAEALPVTPSGAGGLVEVLA